MTAEKSDRLEKIKDIVDYLFVYMLLSLSGNDAFGQEFLFITFALSTVLFFYRKKHFDVTLLLLLVSVVIILLLQAMKFDFFPWFTMAGPILKLLLAYFVIKGIGSTFMEKYVNVMVVLSVISIAFYLPVGLIPGLSDDMLPYAFYVSGDETHGASERHFLGIGTIVTGYEADAEYFRNHGPVWEAGAFGGYLMIALIFNTIRTGQLFSWKSIILMATVLTTVSTTSVLALFMLILAYFITLKEHMYLKWVLAPIVIAIGVASFFQFEFLGEKIEHRLELADKEANINSDKSSRFLDVVRDWRDIEGHELIGRGVHPETRYGKMSKRSKLESRTNGITDHLVRYGAIFLLITIALLYRSQYAAVEYYKNVHKEFAIYSTAILIVLLQSEVYFNFPLFWGLMILYAAYIRTRPKPKKNDSKRFVFKRQHQKRSLFSKVRKSLSHR